MPSAVQTPRAGAGARSVGRLLMPLLISALALSGCAATTSGFPNDGGGAKGAAVAPPPAERLDADYRALLLTHGSRALEVEKYEEAASAYKRILSVEPDNADANFGMAETMLASGNLPAALGHFRMLSANDAYRARSLQGEGIVLLALGRHPQSVESLEKAVVADPALWRSWNALGRTLDSRGKHEEARKSYDRAIELAPESAVALNNRGVSNMLAGRYAEAEADLRRAVALDRTLERARGNLRLVLAWQGKYTEALSDVSRIDAPVALNNIGYIAMKRGDLSHAEAYFAQAMQMSPAFYDKADRNLKFLQEMRKLQKIADTKSG